MDFARYHTEANRPSPDGVPQWQYWERAAARGNRDALRKLDAPEFPERVGYLWRWAQELHGRSGIGMAGLNPLSYTTIAAWADLTGQCPTPVEVDALLALDAIMCAPERKDEPAAPSTEVPIDVPWPEKKEA